MENELKDGQLLPDVFFGLDEKEEKKLYYKLLEFSSDETGKDYIAYTDYEEDEKGNTKAYGAILRKENDEVKLDPIEDEREWKLIEVTLEALQSDEVGNNEEKEA